MINENKKAVLRIISEKLEGKNILWCLVASTNLALQGINIKPRDIDIITDKEGAHKISKIFKNYETREIEFLDTGVHAVYLATYKIKNEEIEVMGGSHIYLPLMKRGIIKIRINDKKIPCLKLEKEYEAYKKLDRKEKVELIKQKLKIIS